MKLSREDAEWLRKIFLAATNGATTERNRRVADWLNTLCGEPVKDFSAKLDRFMEWLGEPEEIERKRKIAERMNRVKKKTPRR